MSNPGQLENDVNRTRESLSSNIGRLNETVSPSNVFGRRLDKLKSGAGSVKERLMGYADNSDGSRSDAVRSAAGTVQDKADAVAGKVGDATGSAPGAVRDKAQGNPLAAGVIAFGVGWLASALIPVSDGEQQLAATIERNADGIVEPLKQSAQDAATNLQQPLQDSAEQLKRTAGDAGSRTAEQASTSKDALQKSTPLSD